MSEFDPTATDSTDPPAERERKLWSTPRLIVSELQSSEGGAVNVAEATSGILS
ncbi:MAG: hypothetical protein WBD71_15200 [Xanthobacteraceae bacterium]